MGRTRNDSISEQSVIEKAAFLGMKDEHTRVFLSYATFIPFTLFGTYVRIGIYKLSLYHPSYVTPTSTIWANITACFLMGAVHHTSTIIMMDPMISTALTTGFCGACSSFSSLIVELFQHSTNQGLTQTAFPHPSYGVAEFIAVLLLQLTASGGGLVFGIKLMTHVLDRWEHRHIDMRNFMAVVGFIARCACIPIIIVILVLSIIYKGSSRFWTLSPLFGIFGSTVRWELSKQFNGKSDWFPVGTFLTNTLGTLIECVLFLLANGLKNGKLIVSGDEAGDILNYLMLGFCGGMTTLSTFMLEGYKAKKLRHSSFYFTLSIMVSYIFTVVIIGSYAWTHGIETSDSLYS